MESWDWAVMFTECPQIYLALPWLTAEPSINFHNNLSILQVYIENFRKMKFECIAFFIKEIQNKVKIIWWVSSKYPILVLIQVGISGPLLTESMSRWNISG